MKSFQSISLVAVLLLMLQPLSYGVEEAAKETVDPVMAEKMEKMKLLMEPTENHKVLEIFAGKWVYTGKFWMTPEATAQDMTGTAENAMIFDGRFLKQEFEGPWMGKLFKGLGFTGYDNVKEEYVTVWLDSVGTGLMTSAGQYDSVTQTLNQSGSNSCPLTGEKARPGRSEWIVVDQDHNTYRSYAFGPDGKEFKAMEISYTRVP